MLCQSETGVISGSEYFFYTPSAMAKAQLFYFTSVGHFFCDYGYKVKRQLDYGNYMIFLVLSGHIRMSAEDKVYDVRAGETAILNCHQPHSYKAMGTTEFLWVHFDGSNTSQLYEDIIEKQNGNHVCLLKESKRLERKLRKIMSDCRYQKAGSELDDSLNIYELLIVIHKNIPGSKHEVSEVGEELMDEAIRFINLNLNKELTIEMIARHIGLSESHFSRKFRKATNSSPKEYIILRRLNEAKILLKTTSHTVREIAFAVGFNSESHFVNTFTAKNGIPPKKFREFPI